MNTSLFQALASPSGKKEFFLENLPYLPIPGLCDWPKTQTPGLAGVFRSRLQHPGSCQTNDTFLLLALPPGTKVVTSADGQKHNSSFRSHRSWRSPSRIEVVHNQRPVAVLYCLKLTAPSMSLAHNFYLPPITVLTSCPEAGERTWWLLENSSDPRSL